MSAGREELWRPWDTCPQDGRAVLARFDDLYCETVCRTPDGWYWYEDGDTSGTRTPTHWMPVPGLLGERPEPVAWASPESLAFFATYRGNEAKTAVCSDRTEYDSVPLYASPIGRTPDAWTDPHGPMVVEGLREAGEPTEAEGVERIAFLEARLTAMVEWLEANRPEVFREGIWDAIHASTRAPTESREGEER